MSQPLLTLGGKQKARIQMIESALKDQAPKAYQDMKLKGQLQEFLQNHEQAMMESYDQERTEAMMKVLSTNNKNPYPARELDTVLHQLWEETLAVWLEFSDGTGNTTTESSLEA